MDDSDLFTCIADCARIAPMCDSGIGAGSILAPADVTQLLAAAAQRWPTLDPAIRDSTITGFLASYLYGTVWRVLADCQREPLIATLQGLADGKGVTCAQIQRRRGR